MALKQAGGKEGGGMGWWEGGRLGGWGNAGVRASANSRVLQMLHFAGGRAGASG